MPSIASQETSGWQALASRLETATAVLTSLAAVAILFSIAVSQALLGAGLLSLLLSRRPLQFPARLRFPLLTFIGWTLLSLAFSSAPWTGLSQVRKLFVFFLLLLVYNAFRNHSQLWRTAQAVALGGTVAAAYGLGQFVSRYLKLREQGLPFYENYVVVDQITGFMGHWLTFSGALMLVFLLLLASVLFRPGRRRIDFWWWLCLALVALALLASFARGVWMGTFAGTVYLLARFRPRLLWALPVGVLLLYLVAPSPLQRRARSTFDAQADTSTRSRLVMFHTGLAMIAAHPWFGLGPERVGPEFLRYKPDSLPLPEAYYGHLHNNFLQLAAERGIPCLIIWLWLIWQVFNEGNKCARSPVRKARVLGHASVAATVGLMVAGMFEFNFGDSEVLMLYLFLFTAPYAWRRLADESALSNGPPPMEPGEQSPRDTPEAP